MTAQQMVFAFGRAAPAVAQRDRAATTLAGVLMSFLPPGSPPCFRKIVRARHEGPKRIVAELEMFDGLPAETEIWQWRPDAWAQKWNRMDGGDICLEDGAWTRADEATKGSP